MTFPPLEGSGHRLDITAIYIEAINLSFQYTSLYTLHTDTDNRKYLHTYIHTLLKEKYTKISYNRQTKSIRSECFETTQLFASDTNDNECNVTNVK